MLVVLLLQALGLEDKGFGLIGLGVGDYYDVLRQSERTLGNRQRSGVWVWGSDTGLHLFMSVSISSSISTFILSSTSISRSASPYVYVCIYIHLQQ